MRTTSSTEKVQTALRKLDELQAQPFRPAKDISQEQIEALKERTPAQELFAKWHDERQKSDQGGDS